MKSGGASRGGACLSEMMSVDDRCQWMIVQQTDLARDLQLGAGAHTLPKSLVTHIPCFLFQCNPRVIVQGDRLAGITVGFFFVPVNNLATMNTSFCAVHYLF